MLEELEELESWHVKIGMFASSEMCATSSSLFATETTENSAHSSTHPFASWAVLVLVRSCTRTLPSHMVTPTPPSRSRFSQNSCNTKTKQWIWVIRCCAYYVDVLAMLCCRTMYFVVVPDSVLLCYITLLLCCVTVYITVYVVLLCCVMLLTCMLCVIYVFRCEYIVLHQNIKLIFCIITN